MYAYHDRIWIKAIQRGPISLQLVSIVENMVEFRNKYSWDQQILEIRTESCLLFMNLSNAPLYVNKMFGSGRREISGVLTRGQC